MNMWSVFTFVCLDGGSVQVADREGRFCTQGARLWDSVVRRTASVQEDPRVREWGCDLAAGKEDGRTAGSTELCWWGRRRWKVRFSLSLSPGWYGVIDESQYSKTLHINVFHTGFPCHGAKNEICFCYVIGFHPISHLFALFSSCGCNLSALYAIHRSLSIGLPAWPSFVMIIYVGCDLLSCNVIGLNHVV